MDKSLFLTIVFTNALLTFFSSWWAYSDCSAHKISMSADRDWKRSDPFAAAATFFVCTGLFGLLGFALACASYFGLKKAKEKKEWEQRIENIGKPVVSMFSPVQPAPKSSLPTKEEIYLAAKSIKKGALKQSGTTVFPDPDDKDVSVETIGSLYVVRAWLLRLETNQREDWELALRQVSDRWEPLEDAS